MTKLDQVMNVKGDEGVFVVSAGNLYRVIAQGKDTGDRFSLMEAMLEPGQAAPYHLHTREDEAFYILEGQVTFYLDDNQVIAKPHDFVSCPPGTVRGFRNETEKDAKMLIFYSAAGIEEMTIRDGEVVDSHTKASDLNKGELIQCPQLAKQYGVVALEKAF